jgi:hypothetical protein
MNPYGPVLAGPGWKVKAHPYEGDGPIEVYGQHFGTADGEPLSADNMRDLPIAHYLSRTVHYMRLWSQVSYYQLPGRWPLPLLSCRDILNLVSLAVAGDEHRSQAQDLALSLRLMVTIARLPGSAVVVPEASAVVASPSFPPGVACALAGIGERGLYVHPDLGVEHRAAGWSPFMLLPTHDCVIVLG